MEHDNLGPKRVNLEVTRKKELKGSIVKVTMVTMESKAGPHGD